MSLGPTFNTIDFRNGLYQGYTNQQNPEGLGLFLDDNLILHCSNWNSSVLSDQTAILISHSKYIYGRWEHNLPHGINVFRSADTVLIANFQKGETSGQFVIIFQKQCFAIIGYSASGGLEVSAKRVFKTQKELKQIVSQAIVGQTVEDEYFSFVVYIKTNFCGEKAQMQINFHDGSYHFGLKNGLGVMFDDDNYINKMGMIDQEGQMCGLGVLYQSNIQVGNFSNGLVIKHREGQKPEEDIRKLFKNEHRKSIYFKNDFMFTRTADVVSRLEQLIRTVITVISDQPIDTDRNVSRQQLNQSLQYRFKAKKAPSQESQRLKRIRQELYRSVGKPIDIRPAYFQETKPGKYPEEIKQLHLATVSKEEYAQPQSISFSKLNGACLQDNRRKFIDTNKLNDYAYTTKVSPLRTHKYQIESVQDVVRRNIISPYQSKSPSTNPKSNVQKTPTKNQLRQSQDSTAFKEPRPKETFQRQREHVGLKVQVVAYQHNPQQDSLESPYQKKLFRESIRTSVNRQTNKDSSREVIPISHSKAALVKQVNQSKPSNKQSPLKYIGIQKAPVSSKVYQNQPIFSQESNNQKRVAEGSRKSPLKNPHYQKESPQQPEAGLNSPTRPSHPYLQRAHGYHPNRESPESRSKMVEKIGKKYKYVDEES